MAYPTYIPNYSAYQYQPYTPYMRMDTPQYNMPQVGTIPSSNSNSNTIPIQQAFTCRPVTSKEEALGVQADYLSAGTIMPDLGHGMIYLKRFDTNTGLSTLTEFSMIQPSNQEHSTKENTPLAENYTDMFRSFGEKISFLAEKIDTLNDKFDVLETSRNLNKVGDGE